MKLRTLIIATVMTGISLPLFAQKEESPSLLKAAIKGWHVQLRAGVNIGGTSPLPLPQEIRAINSYNPTLCLSIEGDANKRFENSKFGLRVGARLETKGMKTDATVKNYHMEMTASDGGYMEGAWTGNVKTRVRCASLSFPILMTYDITPRWQVNVGPYLGWMYDGEFTGSAYDGYLRDKDPTGNKAEVSSASYDFSSDLRKFQWGAQFGVQWKAYKHLAVYADMECGLNNVFPSDYSSVTFSLYPVYANIGCAYLF